MTPAKKIYWICTSIESTTTPVLKLCLQNSRICSLKTAISLLLFIIATLQIYFHLREAFSLSVITLMYAKMHLYFVFVTKIRRHYKFYIPPPPTPVPLTVYLSSELSIPSREIHNKHIAPGSAGTHFTT